VREENTNNNQKVKNLPKVESKPKIKTKQEIIKDYDNNNRGKLVTLESGLERKEFD